MVELERLRAAYREIEPAGTDHLSDEQWERLACDEGDRVEREPVLEHVLSCPQCSQVYRGVLAVRRQAHTFDPGAPAPARETKRPRMWRGLLAGLVAAAAVVAVILVIRPQLGTSPTIPSGNESMSLRSGESVASPLVVSPRGELSAPPAGFSWQAVPGARGYVVELLGEDGEPVWTSDELKTASTPWPSTVPAAKGRYYWRVLAIPRNGGEPVASDLESFDVDVSASPR
ncbi:MAG: hypothetical protein GXP47_05600 [Acidobacteria bacterium]|nr:hypothetical protein [Acidobacteriota bacterium]